MEEWNTKVVLVTGGSSGIGKELVKRFVKEGAVTYFTYCSNEVAAKELCEELGQVGTCNALYCDVSKEEDCKSVVKVIKKESKIIDVLVNNAGITNDGLFIMQEKTSWKKVIDVNLFGTYNMLSEVVMEMLIERKGAIVNVASIAGGKIGVAGQTNYCTAKAGIVGMTKALAKEVAAKNIRVNAVAPGYIITKMTENLKGMDKLRKSIPAERFGTATEVANVVLFLASDAASYVNGEVIVVDGGLSA